jgi:hypothetical protein
MIMRPRRFFGLIVAGFGTLAWTGAAYALAVSDFIELTDNTGAVLTDIGGKPAIMGIQESDESGGNATVTVVVPTTAASIATFAGVALTDGSPSVTGRTPLSDTVTASTVPNGAGFAFEATLTSLSEAQSSVVTVDCNPQSPTFSGATCFAESPGGAMDVSGLLGLPSALDIHVIVESGDPVPEPGTLLLLTSGLVALAARGGRRLR